MEAQDSQKSQTLLNRAILHGGDYNPDQWLDRPDIIDEDFRLFKLAGINTVSLGIFAWTRLEPAEGAYDFSWLDALMDRAHKENIGVILASPSGAKPAWMSQKYPEIRRCSAARVRDLQGKRHNHCYTSPKYREKIQALNTQLAKRYANHPALMLWHVSNEYGGECHCPLCQEAFRTWLKKKYGNLEALNAAWWTDFWSHRYTDWEQIESPSPQGEDGLHALVLDWRRFVDHQSLDFFRWESAPLRSLSPNIPITVNMMGTYPGLNYWNWAPYVDYISWDSYPAWHSQGFSDVDEASHTAFVHDLMRSLKKGKPWLLMESTPSQVNWRDICKLKKPGMHRLSSLQALAHGSNSVLYFQLRKGRGASEKFHGAVIDHEGSENGRVFKEVAQLGEELKGLSELCSTRYKAEAALIYDWENRWALEQYQGFNRLDRDYEAWCMRFYKALWQENIALDIPNQDQDFGSYKLLVVPWLYLLKESTAQRFKAFVEDGGILVASFGLGQVNATDLCYTGGFPGLLREFSGLWAEETDPLFPGEYNYAVPIEGNPLGLKTEGRLESVCELLNTEGAETLAVYKDNWYAGRPVLCRKRQGKGWFYYLAAKADPSFIEELISALIKEAGLVATKPAQVRGLELQKRSGPDGTWTFEMNFNDYPCQGLEAYGCRISREN